MEITIALGQIRIADFVGAHQYETIRLRDDEDQSYCGNGVDIQP